MSIMSEQQSSYRQIMKATSIFGSVQVVQILINILRSKALALLLGPSGLGIYGLFTSTTNLITSISNFGLGTSAVKNIAAAYATENKYRVSVTIKIFRRLVWVTGVLGTIMTLVLASWLSKLTFGNTDYTLAFRWVSITLLLNQLSAGQIALLRGARQLKYLAQASLTGSLLGLLISLPVYYYFRIDGIVIAIILTSIVNLLRSWYFSKKIEIENTKVDGPTFIRESKDMVTMGMVLGLTGIIGMGTNYLTKIYISNTGDVREVGLYTAGFVIVNTYVGMVFTALGTDYYPRLSSVATDDNRIKILINQQSEISLLILSPLLILFILLGPYAIIILYSNEFTPIETMVQLATLGIYFKASSWTIAYLLLAKGDSLLYMLNEIFANLYILFLNIIGYKIAGFTGIGISYIIAYMIYLLQLIILSKIKYNFEYTNEHFRILSIVLILGFLSFAIVSLLNLFWFVIASVLIALVTVLYSYKKISNRINLAELIAKFIKIKH